MLENIHLNRKHIESTELDILFVVNHIVISIEKINGNKRML